MDLHGEHHFDAPRATVWEALLDADALRAALPGCERFERVGEDSYDVTLRVGLSAIKGTYDGNVTISDANPQESLRLAASGSGRPGRVSGEATIRLAAVEDGTLLSYDANVRPEGPIARLGGRILGGAARTMARRFFAALEEQIQEPVR
jgi:carbon monoxide dehydrogenase subunit G